MIGPRRDRGGAGRRVEHVITERGRQIGQGVLQLPQADPGGVLGRAPAFTAGRPSVEDATMLVFAHVSDTHIDLGPRALDRTRRVIARLRGQALDAILVTGDIADHGEPGEYEQAREVLTADVPVLVLPGNHDERGAFGKVLLGAEQTGPVNRSQSVNGVLFLLCDSSIPGRPDGRLEPETLDWIRATLAGTTGPAFICLHHPPVVLHQPLLDEIRLDDAGPLAAIVADQPQVVAVLCGHVHSSAVSQFGGRPLVVAPGVVSTLRLPWTLPEPLTSRTTLDFDEPPGIAYHVLDDDGRLSTHFRTVA